jgi:glycogen synthase
MVGDINGSVFKNVDNYQVSIQLKYILEKKLSVEEFSKWFLSISEHLAKYNLNMYDFFSRLLFLRNNDELCTIFFKYLKVIGGMNLDIHTLGNKELPLSSRAYEIINRNKLGPIAFVAPELGRWSTVGGLGIMVDELSQGLVHLGEEVIVISPYYEKNRKGESGYLSRDPVEFKHIGNIDVILDQKFTFGVHHGVCNGVKLYFLHNFDIFPSPYSEGSVSFILRQICLFSKASLELLCFIKSVPAVILTNDWFGAMTPAYSKCGHFGDTFKGTTFFHIVHNLEAGYEGRLYPANHEGTLDYIHKLPVHCLVDPFWKAKVINPSRCALLMSDQWGTVSPSYRKDLCETSPMAPLLNNHKKPFAFPNGIFRAQRIKALEQKAGTSHLEAKKALQKKYFNFQDADYSIPLYSFVGRITLQKGVLLILDCVETLINRAYGKINIIVGGMGNMKDPYVIQCVNKINYLRHKYPHNFWANPNEFFTDGPLINLGSDFGLMPSLFEPGGIVQHEFFIAGTPVIAFRTGGLKDTVLEFDWLSQCGNGIVFNTHNFNEFVNAVDRSMALFKNQELYDICRQNAFVSAIDVLEVSKNWNKEFYRLREKVFYNINESDDLKEFSDVSADDIRESLSKFNYKDYVFLKEAERVKFYFFILYFFYLF